jgi:CheY-like chemotaxis protein
MNKPASLVAAIVFWLIALAQLLRAEEATREIPIMAKTASVMTADRQKITDAGFDAFQSKPLKVKDFVAAVERLLDHPGK